MRNRLAIWLAVVLAVGCGAESGRGDESFEVEPQAGSGGTEGAAGVESVAGSGGGPTSRLPTAGNSGRSGSDAAGAGGAGGDSCAATSLEAEKIEHVVEYEVTEEVTTVLPVALYFMIDRSGSMEGAKWNAATQALRDFIHDPASENVDVAVSYFPTNNWLDDLLNAIFGQPPSCDGSEFLEPAVPIGRLPDHAAAVEESLSIGPEGSSTPIEPALRGMTQFCAQFQADHPDEKCVGVFVSDGEPSGCSLDHALLTSVVADAHEQDVQTFVIGMEGADYALLDAFAEAGGTDCDPNSEALACDAGAGSSLLEALQGIRDVVTETETRTETRIETEIMTLDCEFSLPDPPEDEMLDPEKVNVDLTEPGGDAVQFVRVDGEGSCGDAAEGGWYYDDPDAPTRVLTCPDACDRIQASEEGRIDIVLGCKSRVLE